MTTVTLPDIESFKQKLLQWAQHFRTVCLLDNNHYPNNAYKTHEWILAVDVVDEISCGPNAFEQLKAFQQNAHAEIFGYFTYDLKNQVEKLQSNNHDGIGFPEMYFFKPRYLFEVKGDKVTVNRNYPETFELVELIGKQELAVPSWQFAVNSQLKSRTEKEQYIENVKSIRLQIEEGDYYELNYCNEFYAEGVEINPLQGFNKLNEKAKAPFSAFFKLNDKYLLCASPERFLKKEGSKLISQPIKGTIRRLEDKTGNEQLKEQLRNDIKERAENVMIVDLVRNDLARSSEPGSVQAEELFGIYEFNTVIQMISTVASELREDVHFIDAIKNAFPMGSMTGAPKVIVMQAIEKYETTKRGLFSGSIGYIKNNGDFDFNVVIRSIQYNAATKYLSIMAGGAITYDSIPEKEYDEMMLKAKGMMDVVGGRQ